MKHERVSPPRRRRTPVHRQSPDRRRRPKSNYELFNCNNLNIRYWSWNYRGCWPRAQCVTTPTTTLDATTTTLDATTTTLGRIVQSAQHNCHTGQCRAFPPDPVAPQSLRRMGAIALSILSHRMGLARPLGRLREPADALACVTTAMQRSPYASSPRD